MMYTMDYQTTRIIKGLLICTWICAVMPEFKANNQGLYLEKRWMAFSPSPCNCVSKECYCVDFNTCNETTNSIITGRFMIPRSSLQSTGKLTNCPEFEMCCPLEAETTDDTNTNAVRQCCSHNSKPCPHQENDFPWMLAVVHKQQHKTEFLCGALLFHSQTAITNTVCVNRYRHKQTLAVILHNKEIPIAEVKISKQKALKEFALLILKHSAHSPIPLQGHGKILIGSNCCIFVKWNDKKGKQLQVSGVNIRHATTSGFISVQNDDLNPNSGACRHDWGSPLVCIVDGYAVALGIIKPHVTNECQNPMKFIDIRPYKENISTIIYESQIIKNPNFFV